MPEFGEGERGAAFEVSIRGSVQRPQQSRSSGQGACRPAFGKTRRCCQDTRHILWLRDRPFCRFYVVYCSASVMWKLYIAATLEKRIAWISEPVLRLKSRDVVFEIKNTCAIAKKKTHFLLEPLRHRIIEKYSVISFYCLVHAISSVLHTRHNR